MGFNQFETIGTDTQLNPDLGGDGAGGGGGYFPTPTPTPPTYSNCTGENVILLAGQTCCPGLTPITDTFTGATVCRNLSGTPTPTPTPVNTCVGEGGALLPGATCCIGLFPTDASDIYPGLIVCKSATPPPTTSTCTPDGQSCRSNSDCCSKECVAQPFADFNVFGGICKIRFCSDGNPPLAKGTTVSSKCSTTSCKRIVTYNDGNCGTYTEEINDTLCCCDAKDTIKSSQCSTSCKKTVTYNDGNCKTYTKEENDIKCCQACPAKGTLVQCVDQQGTAKIYTGERNTTTFECITQTVTNDTRCKDTYTITLEADPSNGGTVSGTSPLTTTPSTTVVSRLGEVVSFSASPKTGYKFSGWYLNGTLWSNNASARVLVAQEYTFVAKFTQESPQTCTDPNATNFNGPAPCVYPSTTCNDPNATNFGGSLPCVYPPATCTDPSATNFGGSAPCTYPSATCTDPKATNFGGPTPCTYPPPPPPQWRSCITGEMEDGTPPSSYISALYSGAGNGICWEPAGEVGFEPSLQEALTFTYQRGSSELPQPKAIKVVNPSYAITYSITMETNSNIIIEPKTFRLAPRESKQFTVNVTPELLAQLGDGTSTLDLNITIEQG